MARPICPVARRPAPRPPVAGGFLVPVRFRWAPSFRRPDPRPFSPFRRGGALARLWAVRLDRALAGDL